MAETRLDRAAEPDRMQIAGAAEGNDGTPCDAANQALAAGRWH